MRNRAATGVGFLQETAPVLNRQTWLLAQDHSIPSATSGDSAASASLQPPPEQHIPVPSPRVTGAPDPQGICKPKERSQTFQNSP